MAFLTVVLAVQPADPSHSADDAQAASVAEALVPQQALGRTSPQALAQLGDRVAAVETATVALVGHPLEETAKPASRTLFRTDPDDPVVVPVTSGLTVEQLPARVQDARDEVAAGDVATAAQAVTDVETDVLLVALDLGDQSAQNAALSRLLVAADPQVAALDAAVGATHAAAEVRDVVAAAVSAVQARDAAVGVTLAAQQFAVAGAAGDEAAQAAVAKVEQQARSTDGYTNGNIPLKVLCPVAFAPSQHLRCDAAEALGRMDAAYRAAFGHDLKITGSYRTLEEQVSTRAAKGTLAAVPGTSNHGWGLAIDLDQANGYGSELYAWLKANAMQFGWHHPTYMDEGGRGPHEPWHWEFGTTDDAGTGTSMPITVGVAPTTPAPTVPVQPAVEQPSAPPAAPPAPVVTPAPTPTPTPTSSPTASPAPTAAP
ncbi:M15 family metallopeptidase [Cellulomonas sp. P5_C6]